MRTPFDAADATGSVLKPAPAWEMAVAYHRRTKHQPHRYALSPGYLDWANQPNPFRRFDGADETALPLSADCTDAAPSGELSRAKFVHPLDIAGIGAFFQLSLGLSAWKQAGGSRWALRCNPSSGNLHPTEGYLLARGIPGIPDGIHHYAPHDHLLERRCVAELPITEGSFLVGLSSVHWREAWKYGERAFRYCQHDVGHALAALRYAAASLGWSATLLDEPGDDDIASLLGLNRSSDFADAEPEHPDALVLVSARTAPMPLNLDDCVAVARAGQWTGAANRLSAEVRPWPIIEEVADATAKPRTDGASPDRQPRAATPSDARGVSTEVIFQRRSAQAFDGHTGVTRAAFLHMIEATAPDKLPFDVLPWSPLIHPVVMVHRVEDLAPGIYAYVRDASIQSRLQAAMRPEYAWEAVRDARVVGLYLLVEGDSRAASRTISCGQDIASDGAFTLGMLADFAPVLQARGAWWYRRLFWEAGVVGQALYLAAETAGVRGTGIGCYLDDLFHGMLGLEGTDFQSLYHFTVGMPVEDARLETLPPYAHLSNGI